MARLIGKEFDDKVAVVNQAIDDLIEQSNKSNLCTVPKVVSLANQYIEEMDKGYSNLSRSTIDSDDKNPKKKEEWKAAYRRIKEHRELWKKSVSKAQKRIDNVNKKSNEWEALCREQNTTILALNKKLLEQRKEIVEGQHTNAQLVKQLNEFGI